MLPGMDRPIGRFASATCDKLVVVRLAGGEGERALAQLLGNHRTPAGLHAKSLKQWQMSVRTVLRVPGFCSGDVSDGASLEI